jgi:TBC1 domain family member 15
MWLFVCVAILEIYQNIIMQLEGFDEILQFVNQLSGKIDVQQVVTGAEMLFYRFTYLVQFIEDDDLLSIS